MTPQSSCGTESGGESISILKQFADRHRLNISRDECGDLVIQGKNGQVYEYSDSVLAAMFMPAAYKPRLWGTHRKAALALGLKLLQDGDSEGTMVFDPNDHDQAKEALKIARIKRRKKLSPERIAELSSYLQKARNSRSNPSVEGHFSV